MRQRYYVSFALLLRASPLYFFFFFFNDTATTEIYTLSLHDALPICRCRQLQPVLQLRGRLRDLRRYIRDGVLDDQDRKSTRLNSSHDQISYAVFCLKKKKKQKHATHRRRWQQDWQRADADRQ